MDANKSRKLIFVKFHKVESAALTGKKLRVLAITEANGEVGG